MGINIDTSGPLTTEGERSRECCGEAEAHLKADNCLYEYRHIHRDIYRQPLDFRLLLCWQFKTSICSSAWYCFVLCRALNVRRPYGCLWVIAGVLFVLDKSRTQRPGRKSQVCNCCCCEQELSPSNVKSYFLILINTVHTKLVAENVKKSKQSNDLKGF